MATPTWRAASVGYRGDSGLITQLLGGHGAAWVYANPGAVQDRQATGAAIYQSLQSGYVSQAITTGASQTAIGLVAAIWLVVTYLHVSPLPFLVGLSVYPLAIVAFALTHVAPAESSDPQPDPLEDPNG